MAKNKNNTPNLFTDFKKPKTSAENIIVSEKISEDTNPIKKETVLGINEPEDIDIDLVANENAASKKPENTAFDKENEHNGDFETRKQENVPLPVQKRPIGRPRNEYKKILKSADVTFLDEYVVIRAKRLNMTVETYLRCLILKDVKENPALFDLLIDKEKISGEIDKIAF